MTLVFFHLPKTGGTSVNEELHRIVSTNSLKSLAIHQNNTSEIKNYPISYFENHDYIHMHACGFTDESNLATFLKNNSKNNFTIFRYPTDLVKSYWRHSCQIAPQFAPKNKSLPPFHDRFSDLESLVHSISKNGEIDFTNKIFNDYSGLWRIFLGQIYEIQISMGCDQSSVYSIINYFLLEDPMLSKRLKLYVEGVLGHKTDFNLKHLNKTQPMKNSNLNQCSERILSSTLSKDLRQYLKILNNLEAL